MIDLRMVVMAGWFVGFVCFGFLFFLFNFKFWVETFSNVGGHPHKRVLVLAYWGGGPEQVNHGVVHMFYADCTLLFPLPLLLGYCYFPLLC